MRAIYVTSPDRVGAAVAMGAAIGALLSVLASLSGGEKDPVALAGMAVTGFVVSAGMIALLGFPAWWLARRRGPVAAALTGAAVGFVLLLSAQTYGLGIAMPPEDGRTLAVRWVSAAAVAGLAGLGGAGVALAMWLVGYRRL